MTKPPPAHTDLAGYRHVTVVCAHPDDESFGLGAIITTLADAGTRLRLVCFTAGESSTLGRKPGPRRTPCPRARLRGPHP